MRTKYFFFFFFLPIMLGGCSGYEKLLKSADVTMKYTRALEYYHKGDYIRAGTLFDMINPFYKGTNKADTISFYYAQCLYEQGDYIMAGHFFKEFAQTFPRSHFAEEADFMYAYCNYLNSPRPTLDQQSTDEAVDALQLFMIKYPKSTRIQECKKYYQELRERLMTKSYLNAKLYFDLRYYKAAIVALRNSLNEFPDSKYREDVMYLIVKSTYLLAENSVLNKQKERYQNTLDEYYSFASEFPGSKYSSDIQKIYKDLSERLKL